MDDPRRPVVVGGAQLHRTTPDDRDAIGLMASCAEAALADTGRTVDPAELDLVAVVAGLWSWHDPGRLVAEAIGATGARTMLTTFGGQVPQALVGELADRIARGELDAAIVCGGETNHTRRRLRARGERPPRRPEPDGRTPGEVYGDALDMADDVEATHGLVHPRISYAVVESALMAEAGRTADEHRRHLGALWARWAEVAAGNPHAADRSAPDAATIAEPGPGNRMVAWPYTKALCANNDVDMAAALVVCSAATATAWGVDRDRWVFPVAATLGADTTRLTNRWELHESPALADAGTAVLDRAGIGIDDVAHLELYGCFPALEQITASALGIDPTRRPTQTGGLGFAGAGMNTSTLHGLCAMTDTLRNDPGALGLVQGNGGHITHHAFGVYRSTPPDRAFRLDDRRATVRPPSRSAAPPDAVGPATVEGHTVTWSHDGPETAIVGARRPDGARSWRSTDDRSVIEWLVEAPRRGATVRLTPAALEPDRG